ncbi:MAG: PAS domain S-box protein [Burkholderiales bacterium]|nr:PAS domain S-box protein [Burkholderiales bacterium]
MNERALDRLALHQDLKRLLAERSAELIEAKRKLEQETVRHLETEQALLESNARLKLAEARARTEAEQIALHRNALLELAQLDETHFEAALKEILRADAEALDVERVSYWTISGASLQRQREMMYLKSRGVVERDASALTLDAERYPRYFAALATHEPIVAHHAQTDPATSEFTDGFLKPLDISSLLDVAVWSRGKIAGVLCHSHVGPAREWSAEEVKFAASIANNISLALEAAHRHELATALRRSEEKYRLVVEHAGEGMFVTQDRRVCFANPRAAELVGLDCEQMSLRMLEELIHPDDRARVLGNYEKRLRRQAVENNYTFRTREVDGESRWLQINAVAIDWEGRPATLSFVSDVTERVCLTEELRANLAEREAILETSVVGLAFIQAGRIMWINTVLEQQMFGYDKNELIGVHSEVAYRSHEHWKAFLRAAVPMIESGRTHEVELQLKRKDGSLFWALSSGRAIDSDDLAKGSIWALTDISERMKLQQDLQKTLIEREAILQSTLVGITFAIGRRHIWINQKLADMLGYRPEELIGQMSVIHFPSPDAFEAFGAVAYPALERGESYTAECQMKRKDGSLICCQLYGVSIVPGKPERGSIWTFVDITELKRALEKEKELGELKSRFVSMTSHEFRTPLATILSATELLENYAERLPKSEKTELIGLIKGSVKHMTHMLEQVLLIGKADAGKLEFKPAPLDLEAFCRKIIGELAQADGFAHRLVFRREPMGERHAVDEKLLRHILCNLLGNALKYSPEGSEVSLKISCANNIARLTVTDNGIGILPEDQPHLFDSFHRGKNVSNIAGTGLGLAIVIKAVTLHGGSIEFQSELNRGTTFVVSLPAPEVTALTSLRGVPPPTR